MKRNTYRKTLLQIIQEWQRVRDRALETGDGMKAVRCAKEAQEYADLLDAEARGKSVPTYFVRLTKVVTFELEVPANTEEQAVAIANQGLSWEDVLEAEDVSAHTELMGKDGDE